MVKRKKHACGPPGSDGLRAVLTPPALELEYKVLAGEAKCAHTVCAPWLFPTWDEGTKLQVVQAQVVASAR